MESNSEIIIYQQDDGNIKIDVRLEDENIWLTNQLMADLFQTTKQNISLHISNIFKEAELRPEATVKEYLTVQKESNREVKRKLEYYNLEADIKISGLEFTL